ncbi:MAG: MFS transporter [Opitutae bacterium]|jgi:MFS family permease|nr:MFS transporter [Opitutae bacterium]MBT5716822.1 MFS transporter [Opitutae bacterium]
MSNQDSQPDMKLFWGCFIALITTAFAFITRAFLVNAEPFWPSTFGLDQVQAQELFGAGIWPFAISIIVFSLIIDNIGYRAAMFFSFICYALYAVLAFQAYGVVTAEGLTGDALKTAQVEAYDLLYMGSIILGLGNGTVEAFINPVVATMFNKDKTKWLNILHAGWPGGLVLGGILTILLGEQAAEDWRILIYLIAIPAVVYLVMLLKAQFPVNERVSSGTSYKEMLAEFGAIGALIAGYLIFRQLGMVFGWEDNLIYGLTAVATIAYGFYCKSFGRPILIFMCIIMIPLATTELGTDGAISGLMEEPMKAAGQHPLWVLIYTSAIMMVLRFWFAGPIVAKLGPLGLLATSAVLAIAGLYLLSTATGLFMVFACATLYGFGKTFFWPTTLGVVSEQCPKGGALTLNAIAGIGMLAVGILGGPVIGKLTEDSIKVSVEGATSTETYNSISKDSTYFLGDYTAVDSEKLGKLVGDQKLKVEESIQSGKQGSLASVAVFPFFMLVCYIALILYFKNRGGYKPVEL